MAQARQGGLLVPGWFTGVGREEPQAGALPGTGDPPGEASPDDVVGATHAEYGTPLFAAPGLVLLATLTICAGYHWLRLIPTSAPRPMAVALAVVVVPATYLLTRHVSGPGTERVRTVARGCADLLPALWVVLLVVHDVDVADVLGVVSLVLALSLVVLAVLSEVGEHLHTGTY